MLQRSLITIPDCAPCPSWCTAHESSYRWDWDFAHPTGEVRQAEGSRVCAHTLGQVIDMVGERVDVGLARFEAFDTTEHSHELLPPRVVVWGQLHLPLDQARQLVALLSEAINTANAEANIMAGVA